MRRALVLRLVGGLHALAFLAAMLLAARDWPTLRRSFDVASHPVGNLELVDAAVFLPPLFAEVPRDASIVVVADTLQAIPFEMHALPRPTVVLYRCEERALQPRPHVPAKVIESLRRRFDDLERRGRRFTPARYADALASTRWLLVFGHEAADLFPPGFTFRALREFHGEHRAIAAIYAVERSTDERR